MIYYRHRFSRSDFEVPSCPELKLGNSKANDRNSSGMLIEEEEVETGTVSYSLCPIYSGILSEFIVAELTIISLGLLILSFKNIITDSVNDIINHLLLKITYRLRNIDFRWHGPCMECMYEPLDS